MRKKQLPWNLHYLGHAPMPTIIHSLFSFVQTVSPCVKPSYRHILECSPFAIPSVPSHLKSLSSGSLAIHLFQATILQTKQQKNPLTSLQMHHFPSLYLAPFKSSTKWFVTCHQHTNKLSINFEAFIETSNRLPTEEMTHCSPTVWSSPFSKAIPPSSRSFSRSNLLELPRRRTRSCSLAPRLSSSVIHEATRVWVRSRVIRVACHPTWGCSGVCKEDPGKP